MRFIRIGHHRATRVSDICADAGQVFLASIVLPSFGFGGAYSFSSIVLGSILTFVLFLLALLIPSGYDVPYES